jgi:hypothetical protein
MKSSAANINKQMDQSQSEDNGVNLAKATACSYRRILRRKTERR